MIGQTFERLTVLEIIPKTRFVVCECKCGTTKKISKYHLLDGHTRSCGCLYRETRGDGRRTHGMSRKGRSPEYAIWCAMRRRCADPNDKAFQFYGGRGISICKRWEKFENFFADMGPRPSPEMQIDRVDNDKNYSPSNCRWATRLEQCNNRRSNVFIEAFGETLTPMQWQRKLGVDHRTIQNRRARGWNNEDAVAKPMRVTNGK